VNDVADDRNALENLVKGKTGKKVILEENEVVTTKFESVTLFVTLIILVKEYRGGGLVNIHTESAELVDMLRTGPQQPENFWVFFLEGG
jgi:hypothetical protein